VQNQEFGDPLRLHIGSVRLAISLEGGAGAQQSDPLQVDAFRSGRSGLMEFMEVRAHQSRDGHGTFEIAPGLDELPALTVGHGGIGDALEQMRAFFDGLQEIAGIPHFGRTAAHGVEQAIQLLPHFRADLLAHLARIFPRVNDTGDDGGSIGRVVQQ